MILFTDVEEITNIYLVYHEQALYPQDRLYDYMSGKLRESLEKKEFGDALTKESYERIKLLGKKLKDKNISEIITDDFITCRETAKYIAEELDDVPVLFDSRLKESDLSYLTKKRFDELVRIARYDPFIFTRDWLRNGDRKNFKQVLSNHIDAFSEDLESNEGKNYLYVLHVEGLQILVSRFLDIPIHKMVNLHFNKGSIVKIELIPGQDPLISF